MSTRSSRRASGASMRGAPLCLLASFLASIAQGGVPALPQAGGPPLGWADNDCSGLVIGRLLNARPLTIDVFSDSDRPDALLWELGVQIDPYQAGLETFAGLLPGDWFEARLGSFLYDAGELAMGRRVCEVTKRDRPGRSSSPWVDPSGTWIRYGPPATLQTGSRLLVVYASGLAVYRDGATTAIHWYRLTEDDRKELDGALEKLSTPGPLKADAELMVVGDTVAAYPPGPSTAAVQETLDRLVRRMWEGSAKILTWEKRHQLTFVEWPLPAIDPNSVSTLPRSGVPASDPVYTALPASFWTKLPPDTSATSDPRWNTYVRSNGVIYRAYSGGCMPQPSPCKEGTLYPLQIYPVGEPIARRHSWPDLWPSAFRTRLKDVPKDGVRLGAEDARRFDELFGWQLENQVIEGEWLYENVHMRLAPP